MGKGSSQTQTQQSETKINPQLRKASNSVLDALMGTMAVNPWKTDYRGPQMAAANQAQIDVMDATADAGNAFGFDFTSAAEGLPEVTMIDGMPAYDVRGMAKEGMSSGMEKMLDQMYGKDGPFNKYKFGKKKNNKKTKSRNLSNFFTRSGTDLFGQGTR